MREIKFRAWDGKEMHSLVPTKTGTLGMLKDLYQDDDWIVMQFTGLQDKNGKAVYEGDIVNIPESIIMSDGKWDDWLYLCRWNEFTHGFEFIGQKPYGDMSWLLADVDCEVIGNIYENPELVESDNG